MKKFVYATILFNFFSIVYGSNNDYSLVIEEDNNKIILKGPKIEYIGVHLDFYSPKSNYHHIKDKYDFEKTKTESKNQKIKGFLAWLEDKNPEKYNEIVKNNDELREKSKLFIKIDHKNENILVDHAGKLVENVSGRYVIDRQGNLHIVHEDIKNLVGYHTSFLCGEPVICAGEIKIENGQIIQIDNESGHYFPHPFHLDQAISYLNKKGVLHPNCSFKFFLWNGKSKKFNSISDYQELGGYRFSFEEQNKFIKNENENMEYVKNKLFPILSQEIDPVNFGVFKKHQEYFKGEFKNVDQELVDLLWKGYTRLLGQVVYHPDVNYIPKMSAENPSSSFKVFIAHSIELSMFFGTLNTLKLTDEAYKADIYNIESQFSSLKEEYKYFVDYNSSSEQVMKRIDYWEEFVMERARKMHEQTIKYIHKASINRNKHVEVNLISQRLYENSLDYFFKNWTSSSKYMGNSLVVNHTEFSEWLSNHPTISSYEKISSFCKTDDTLMTEFILKFLDESECKIILQYKHSSKLENFIF